MSFDSSCVIIFWILPAFTSVTTCDIGIAVLVDRWPTNVKNSTSIATMMMTQTKLFLSHLLSGILFNPPDYSGWLLCNSLFICGTTCHYMRLLEPNVV